MEIANESSKLLILDSYRSLIGFVCSGAESSSDISQASPKQKKARIYPSQKQHSTASESAGRQPKEGEASFPNDHAKEYDPASPE